MAGLARGPSQAVSAAVRRAFDVPGYAAAGVRCRRCSSVRSSSPTPPIASWCWSSSPRSGSRPMCCWSRCGGIPARRSRPVRRSRKTRDEDAVVLALAADHVVRDTRGLCRGLPPGAGRRREAGRIVTFGVEPERPATEYGYISPGEVISGEVRSGREIRREAGSGDGGASTSRPAISGTAATSCSAPRSCSMNTARSMPQACRPSPIPWPRPGAISASSRWTRTPSASAKAISIDYAVMEKTARAAVVPVACGWSDVGSWHAVWELSDKDSAGQRRAGRGGVRGFPQLQCRRPTGRWSRWKASTISWWWRRRTPCWCRGRRMPTA